MQFRSLGLVMPVCLCGRALDGVRRGGSSGTNAAAAIPAAAARQAIGPRRAGTSAARKRSDVPRVSVPVVHRRWFRRMSPTVPTPAYWKALANTVCDDYGAIAGGNGNAISSGNDSAVYSFIGGGASNAITNGRQPILGDGGGDGNVITAQTAVIAGGVSNSVSGQAASIVGGGSNQNAANNAMLGGGKSNTIVAGAFDSFLGSGFSNSVSGNTSVIVGGNSNQNAALNGMLGGGASNTISSASTDAFLGGGSTNTVSGEYGATPPGRTTTSRASAATSPRRLQHRVGRRRGDRRRLQQHGPLGVRDDSRWIRQLRRREYSFAAGARASAAQTGTFVWSDGSDGDTILTVIARLSVSGARLGWG